MKTFAICFVALFAVAAARSVIDDVDGNQSDFDDRILGGEDTTIEQHPHQIIVQGGGRFEYHFGGSIISPTRALTSAERINRRRPAEEYYIQAGTTSRESGANSQKRYLSHYVQHKRFNSTTGSNDIAILFWKEPLTFGANVQAIRLPTANAAVPYGQDAVLTGWGYDRSKGYPLALQWANQRLISNEECIRESPGQIDAGMFCTKGVDGRGACIGDLGGPLVHNNILIGIASSFNRNCGSGLPDVYTRVAFFIGWILQNQ